MTEMPLRWMTPFLDALAGHGVVAHAARAVGKSSGAAYSARRNHPAFARDWDAARPAGRAAAERADQNPAKGRARNWRAEFFEALAETSNVTAAAERAGVAPRLAYKLRRDDAEFAAKWQDALHEGYDHLEMELLGHLRDPRPGQKMDVASALRLLAAHRETVERRRALTAEEDEQATLDSIDAFIEDMRQRRLANAAILIEPETDDGPD